VLIKNINSQTTHKKLAKPTKNQYTFFSFGKAHAKKPTKTGGFAAMQQRL